ncbi:MAG: hypothetical protein JAZ15_05685 [Candidatus Thiodiazotropha endolucinida]|nr:hypothetical protein [Candidatus Thiodiazotropha taylori]MCW4312493.1 hypothetical protein [Candidatus Thiodiazotropha taylori]
MNAYDYKSEPISLLRQLFGDNRAEWPSEHFKDLFVTPTYLKKLESLRPCFLVGGRGTGKTTALQSLRYDSTFERLSSEGMDFGDQEYLGILVRMNKNRVRAFQGNALPDEQWTKVFAHYFNLISCLELTDLGIWLQDRTGQYLTTEQVQSIANEFGFNKTNSLDELRKLIKDSISALQLYVNNPNQENNITLSIAEAPLRTFSEVLCSPSLADSRVIFCCIDEYENLLDYQQAILNTYIKHSEPPLSYKVGVRKNGLRCHQTLDQHDLLRTPDDYAEIEIADEGFEYFAKAVAELRLKCAKEHGAKVPETLSEFLDELTFEDEAELLGSQKVAAKVLKKLKENDVELSEKLASKPISEISFLSYWQERSGENLTSLARDWLKNGTVWETRIGNHGYSSLFWLSLGNKGVRIRKYYCGYRVFLSLPAGNIRFFLELIDAAIAYQLEESNYNTIRQLSLSPKSQTLAARDVGTRRLNQIEGLADHGVQLKRLILAIGKVFFELARSPVGKTPEVTSFVVSGSPTEIEKIQEILVEGVGHLAFEASPRTKATSNLEIRDNEYRLHRIFCGFFEISHRKKRRLTFKASDLLKILEDKPSSAISSLLSGQHQANEQDLPEQLAFFQAFYDDGSSKE